MNFSLISDYSLWFIPLILIISGLLTWVMYFLRPQSDLIFRQRLPLAVIRFLLLTILGFLLLKPLVQTIRKFTNKPIIIFAQDNSRSISMVNDSIALKSEYQSQVRNLLNKLSSKYQVDELEFGENVETGISFDFKYQVTDFSNLFSIFSTQYYNKNVGALILASDGIYNQGKNPELLTGNTRVPIYTIQLGDTTRLRDIRIEELKYNRKVFKGSQTPVFVNVSANGLNNKNTIIKLLHNNNVIDSKNININATNYFEKILFKITPDERGLQKYDVIIESVDGDQLNENNYGLLVVEVEDKQKEILFLQDGWHPDAKAFSMALDKHPAYNLNVIDVNMGTDTLTVDDYDLIVFHQLPSVQNGIPSIIKAITKLNKPVLFVMGEKISISAFNQLNVGVKVSGFKNNFDNTNPVLNTNFTLFKFDDNNDILADFPPLSVPFGEISGITESNVLLFQALGDLNTFKPLIFFPETGGYKVGIIFGEGIWRWRLNEYAKTYSHNISNQLVNKTIQYLISESEKERFIVEVPSVIPKNQLLRLNASLFNAAYELITKPDVKLDLTDEEGQSFQYYFNKSELDYFLEIQGLEAGIYRYTASTNIGDESFIKNGSFVVKEFDLESQSLEANYNLLYKMSENTGGRLFNWNNLLEIEHEIDNNVNIYSKSYTVKSMQDLADKKIIFLVLVLLLSAEWLLRKIWGTR